MLILTVEHQSPELTARMIISLERLKGNRGASIVIIRNGESDVDSGMARLSCGSFGNVWVYRSEANKGYFGGLRQGLEWFQKMQSSLPPWIIVCNNDIRIEQADFFERLSQLDPTGVGVIAPRIICSSTGLDQNPFMVRRPKRWRLTELRFWLKSYYLAFVHEKMSDWKEMGMGLIQRLRATPKRMSLQPGAIYAPHGSFLIFSREFFERDGFLDDSSFLYHEEISVAEICKKIELPIVYHPGLCVLHDEHSTTGKRFTRVMYEHQRQSMEYLSANYFADLVR